MFNTFLCSHHGKQFYWWVNVINIPRSKLKSYDMSGIILGLSINISHGLSQMGFEPRTSEKA